MARKNSIKLSESKQTALESDLKRYGYLLPTSDEEVVEFTKLYGDTSIEIPENLKSPEFLFKKKGKLVKLGKAIALKAGPKKKASGAEYFKNLILAAEIAYQLYEEPTFGHVKFVKIKFLCEEICNMELASNYAKYAAGPLDPKSLHSIDAEFKKRKWFVITKKSSRGYRYEPADNIDQYKKYYDRYFSNHLEEIQKLIDLFRTKKTDFCEVVATLFAVWQEHIQKNNSIEEKSLFDGFYEWSEGKSKFKESELEKTLVWMRENDIIPALK